MTEKLAAEPEIIAALFAALDRGEIEEVASFLDEDVVVHLTNLDPIQGATAFTELYAQVTGTLAGIRHEIHDIWNAAEDDAVWVVRMTVHYTKGDGHTVSLPCCNVFRLLEGAISEYRVFMDMTPVFA
jgi:ketosteroid isomerase-like protein